MASRPRKAQQARASHHPPSRADVTKGPASPVKIAQQASLTMVVYGHQNAAHSGIGRATLKVSPPFSTGQKEWICIAELPSVTNLGTRAFHSSAFHPAMDWGCRATCWPDALMRC